MLPHNPLDSVLVTLRRIVRAIDLHSKKMMADYGMTVPQLLVLMVLHRRGALSVGELAHAVHLSQGTVTSILGRLEKRNLVARKRCELDRRRVLVLVTEAGESLLNPPPPLLHEHFSNAFGQLKDWEQTMMLAVLQRVAEMISATDLDAAPVLLTGGMDEIPESARELGGRH